MNQKFIQGVFLGGLLFSLLAFGNFYANATDYSKKINDNGNVISTKQFYNMLNKTKPNEVALTFGAPDKITTLKDLAGDTTGVVWTYNSAVSRQETILDANFTLVKGEFKYVTLSKAG
ncbi:MAG: hypothetical protein ACKE5M_06095 [Methylophilaceae bacterium]